MNKTDVPFGWEARNMKLKCWAEPDDPGEPPVLRMSKEYSSKRDHVVAAETEVLEPVEGGIDLKPEPEKG